MDNNYFWITGRGEELSNLQGGSGPCARGAAEWSGLTLAANAGKTRKT